jgi:thiol-disulfide isomerase/thioredoxin
MDMIKKTFCVASLIAVFILASSASVMGAEYSLGSENDSWWTKYPDQSSGKGGEVNHPAWVLDALGSKPVVIYAHKGCSYCKPQTEALAKIVDEMGDKFIYFNISADGSDARSEEALQAYDPNGGGEYVPLTVIVTLAPNSEGKVEPVWHSSDEVTGEGWIKNYIEDALGYYSENSANWNK